MTGLRSAGGGGGGGGGGKEEEGEEVAGDAVCWQLVIVSFTLFVKARASNSCIKPGGMSFCILLQPGFIDYIVFIQFCIIKNKIPLVRTRGQFLTTTKTRACLSFASQSFRYHDETFRGLLRSNEGK